MSRKRPLAILFSLLLAGCSSTFLYNQLDWLIPWYVDDYVDLSRDQRRLLDEQLAPLLYWHRAEELQTYLELLDRVEADIASPLDAATIQGWIDEATVALERVERRVLPAAFALGDSLSEDQMQAFIRKLWDRQDELEEEYLDRDEEEYAKSSEKNFDENLREFLGRLTPEQRQRIADAAASLQRFDDLWLAERRAWLEYLTGVLEQRNSAWQETVLSALDERESRQSDAYRAAYLHNQGIINAAVADVLNMRTEKQSRRLADEIDDLRRDLAKLIAQLPDQAPAS